MVSGPGWRRIGPYPAITLWARAARLLAVAALDATKQPLRCGGTWAVGLDLLPNGTDGSVAGQPLPWHSFGLAPQPLHHAQISTIYPGYPQAWDGETDAAFRFRQFRDAAHLDGLLPIGPNRRRMIKEPHAWILGVALTDCTASPLVVYEGSHKIVQAALVAALAVYPPQDWAEVDVTDAYQSARAQVFDTCRRIEVPIAVGQATLLHRLTIHGVAPWAGPVIAPPEGRMIAYFRPLMTSVQNWLQSP